MKRLLVPTGLALLVLAPALASAASPPSPGAVLEGSRDMRQYLESQRRLQESREAPEAEIVDQIGDAKPPAAAAEVRFLLRQVNFSRSEILSADELRTVAGPYVGREVSVADLFALVEQINALYRERRVIAAKAVLPPQKIEQGAVNVRLVEGHVGQIRLQGNASTRDDFITSGLTTLQPGQLVYLDALESDLFYFNSVNDIELRAVLKPGETFGSTDYELQVVEPPRHETIVFADAAGRDDVGLYRLGFNHTNRSLLGYRDALSIGGHVAEGTRALYAAYNFPLNSRGTRLGLSADYSAIEIVDGPLEPLDVSGDSVNAGLFLTHPLQVRRDGLTNAYAGYNFKESTTDFDDVTLFRTHVRSLTAGLDVQRNHPGASWFGRFTVTGAPDAWGNTKAFLRLNADYSRINVLEDGWVLLLRARGQWSSDDLLPSSEQFQVGGMSTVRGYPEGLLIGDRGYFGSVEFSFPVHAADPAANPFTQRWRGILFLDHGAAFPYKGNDEPINDDDFLTSIGGGFGMNLGRRAQGRLVLGLPLGSREDGEDSPRLHFYVQSELF